MRKMQAKWWLAVFLTALFLTGCVESPKETAPSQQGINAGARYSAGKRAAETEDNLMLEYTLVQTRKVEDNTFTKRVVGKASYQNYAQADMTVVVEEDLDFGYYRCSYQEAFYGGRAYASVNDSYFWANQSAEEFVVRQLPPALLSVSLYDTVDYGDEPGTVLFSEPRAMEAWVGEGQLLSASGKAVLTEDGLLAQSFYWVQYQKGAAEYTLEVSVQIAMPEQLDLSSVLAMGQTGAWLADLDAPRYLVQAVADVYTAQRLTCQLSEVITSEAVSLSYQRNSSVLLQGRGDALQAQVLNASQLSNNRGVIAQNSQTELFEKGVYTVSVDGSDPARNGSVTATDMRQYCEDTALSGLLAVKYLRIASSQKDGKLLRLELGCDESFRKIIMQHLTEALQVDLDALATLSENLSSGGYVTVDTDTGLPVSMGMFLKKSHTISGITYQLDYHLEETLSFTET